MKTMQHLIPDFDRKLNNLAKIAVHIGLGIQKGQELLIQAPIEATDIVRLITAEAYRAGAGLVTTLFRDEQAALLRLQLADDKTLDRATGWLYNGIAEAHKNNTARLSILGEDPSLLSSQNPARVSRVNKARSIAAKPMMAHVTNFDINWSIIAYATPAWAQKMFPGEAPEAALAKLWDAIFKTSRADVDDPIKAWEEHNKTLHARAKKMNGKNYAALHFKAPGTDLTVGLACNHAWMGGSEKAKNGVTCNPNVPTEEIFTTPDCRNVNGTARSTKPLSYNGTLIENIEVLFKDGRIIEAHATKGEDVLRDVLKTDEGAARLGEVALVPYSSPISLSGLLFYETLFDENAACHIAIGECYTTCFDKVYTESEIRERGGNTSLIHIDWMIGSKELSLDGITQDGKAEPLMRNGDWVA